MNCLSLQIAPVQAFVERSRRTRDLWASSYLLSWLMAHAALGAEEVGSDGTPAAKVVVPDVAHSSMLKMVRRDGVEKPRFGNLHHRLSIEVPDGADAQIVAERAIARAHAAWELVAQEVWRYYVSGVADLGRGTREIWDRQVGGYWRWRWVASDAFDGMERRKHSPSTLATVERGEKCTTMAQLQELSGYGRQNRKQRDDFWEALRSQADPKAPSRRLLGQLDLRQRERLSSIALVKRLFPKLKGNEMLGDILFGQVHWPSTAYMAAVPWLEKLRDSGHTDRLNEYANLAKAYAPDAFAEAQTSIQGLRPSADAGNGFRLDGNFYFTQALENADRTPLKVEFVREEDSGIAANLRSTERGGDDNLESRRLLLEQLEGLYREVGPPSPFYALLLADGDRLGDRMSSGGTALALSQEIGQFASAVDSVVAKQMGVTVYSGGDDVLALLPSHKALACASELSDLFGRSIQVGKEKYGKASLSCGVVMAHFDVPLRRVLSEGHRLLERIAKEQNGRDSLTVGLLRRGGLSAEWTTTWKCDDAATTGRIAALDSVVTHLRMKGDDQRELTTSLVHRLRTSLSRLCEWNQWSPGAVGQVPEGVDLLGFIRAEVAQSISHRASEADQGGPDSTGDSTAKERAQQLAELIVDLLHPAYRDGSGRENFDRTSVGFDGLEIARFLATEEASDE